MVNMAVNTAVRQKTYKVKRRVVFLAIFHCIFKRFIFKKFAAFNIFCYFNKHLINNAACAYVCVTYFAVTHLTVGQTYIKAGRTDSCERVIVKEFIKIRGFGCAYRIAFIGVANTKTVHYT